VAIALWGCSHSGNCTASSFPANPPSQHSTTTTPSTHINNPQGRVRTKTVKRSARVIVERFYSKLTLDFDTNKRVTDEVAQVPSKRMRNKIAGFVTHLMRRIERGDQVRGISLKLQEEERERRMDFVPETSAVDTEHITVDPDTKDLLTKLALSFAGTVSVQKPSRGGERRHGGGGGGAAGGAPRGDRADRPPRRA